MAQQRCQKPKYFDIMTGPRTNLCREPTQVTEIPELPFKNQFDRWDMKQAAADTTKAYASNKIDKHIVFASSRWKLPQHTLRQQVGTSFSTSKSSKQ